MPTWPTSLWQTPSSDSYSETPPNNVIRTKMDVGPDKVRLRSTSNVRNFEVTYLFTNDEVDILDSFFVNDCKYGAFEFTFPKPRNSLVNITVRFVEPPTYAARENLFTVHLKLEELP